jgi:hypothetical protein
MKNKIILCVAVVVVGIITACSILKKDDGDKDIRSFITSFQKSLTLPDEEILKQFEAKQSKEAILSVIKILQNKKNEFISCTLAYDDAKITRSESGIKIDVDATFKSVNLPANANEYNERSKLTFWIEPWNEDESKSFVITKFEGEELYKSFADIRNDMTYAVDRELAMKERLPIYALAKDLEAKFDTVIWYAIYNDKKYFYVVGGTWENYFTDYKEKRKIRENVMGLIDESGNVVIPQAYELIGTIGFDLPMIVEVKKNGKVGYFNIETKQEIVEPSHDMIIPYNKDGAFAIVKNDSTYGWLDTKYEYHEGFPSSNAQQWVDRFYFIPSNLSLKSGNQAFCEIPLEGQAGYGIVMPPTYLVRMGIFNEIEGGITTTKVPMNGWTEYKETEGTWVENISDKMSALITTIKSRYIEGREDFYENNRIVFIDSKHDTLGTTNVDYDKAMTVKRIADDLLEIKTSDPYYFEDGYMDDYNIPIYSYYKLGESNSVISVKTSRNFTPSAFVKLDSTYLSGEFYHNDETGNETTVKFLTASSLKYIRNEILAGYGYIFPDEETKNQFSSEKYKPRYEKVEDFEDQLTEVDKHNLAFLEKMIKLMEEQKPV